MKTVVATDDVISVWNQIGRGWDERQIGPFFRAYDRRMSVQPPVLSDRPLSPSQFEMPIYTFSRKRQAVVYNGQHYTLNWINCAFKGEDYIVEGTLSERRTNAHVRSMDARQVKEFIDLLLANTPIKDERRKVGD